MAINIWDTLAFYTWRYPRAMNQQRKRVELVQQRQKVRVAFIAMNVPMWKYQRLYDAMLNDSRFEVKVFLSPSIAYVIEQQERDLADMRRCFSSHRVEYTDYDFQHPCDIKAEFDPDIIFYPQPYEHLLTPLHDCTHFYDRLVCFYPYSFMTGKGKLTYDSHFHNLAWRLYYPNEEIRHEAQVTAWNKGRNVRIVGHPNGDVFAFWDGAAPWKPMTDGRPRKRIIWAPHFSFDDKFGQLPRGNFLWMAHFMLDLAQRYQEFVQIAFKPHPRLLTELYAHPEWGKQRTDEYYQMWKDMPNTQLETGTYVDLFMSSDAMIHDSASFVIEYLYTHKPVMFVSRDINHFLTGQTDLSREAFAQFYIGKDEREILDFVDNVVLGGEDPMLSQRMAFYERHLMPPGGKSVAQNTLNDLITSLGLRDVT